MTRLLALLALAAALGPLAALAQPVQQKLTAADGDGGDAFGYSVSASGDVAVVGAPLDDLYRGSAYVFRRVGSAWVEEQKLTVADITTFDNFGISVSVSGDVVLVGAIGDDDHGENSGSAYVFRYDGTSWVEEQKLTATDASANDLFGISVSVSGDVALVGAFWDDDHGFNSGSAYVFRYDGASWVEEQKLVAADGAAEDWFGGAVSVSGDIALVGAYRDDTPLIDSGSAYVFRYDGASWVQEQKLTAVDGSAGDRFGVSVSVSGEVALVGSNYGDGNVTDTGSAYVFRYDGTSWVEEQKLVAADGAAEDWFGGAVSVSGDIALVGAKGSDGNLPGSGSAYVYDLSTPVATEPEAAPASLIVHPPVPNPTAERAAVAFVLAEAAWVRLGLYDVLGREVAVVDAGRLAAGAHRLPLDVSALPAGVYVWRLAAGERVEAGRLTVVR